jgi:hypothetical protein
MAAELPRPGVEVIQVFQTVTPTVITPTLVPCVVGACWQVIDVLTTTATGSQAINPQALVPVDAILLATAAEGTPPVYSGLTGLTLALSLNNGPELDVVFAGSPLSPAQVVATVQAAFSAAGEVDYVAETVESGDAWRIRSLAGNQYQSIQVLADSSQAVLTAFGFGAGRTYTGAAGYTQDSLAITTASFPDPNNNIDYLSVDPSTVRAFLYLGANSSTALLELLQTECFLQNGIGTAAVQTGNVSLAGLTFATAATAVGSTNVTSGALYGSGGTLNGTSLTLNVNGAGATSLVLSGTGNAASESTLFAAIEAQWPTLTASLNTTYLQLTDSVLGASSSIVVTTTPASTALGLTGTYSGTAGTLDGLTLIETFNGASSPLTVTFAPASNVTNTLAQINAVIGTAATAIEAASTNYLSITTSLVGAGASIVTGAGTANTALGLTTGTVSGAAGVAAINAGNGQAVTTLLQFTGANFSAAPGQATVVGTTALTSVADGLTLILDDGTGQQTLTFESATTPTLILSQINALFGAAAGGLTLASLSGGNLKLQNTTLGVTSLLNIVGGTALTALGLSTLTGIVRGAPFAPLPGDEIWIDGVDYATIVQVAPGGNTNQLKINTQVPVSSNVGTAWYIIAKKLNALNANSGVTRPYPNLVVNPSTGNFVVKPEVLRNIQGTPVYPAMAQLYVQYSALRLDVSPAAASPGLLSFSDTTTLLSQLGPIDSDNPLGLGMYFALINAPSTTVVGIGVDAVSSGSPFGTVDAFTRAATFLEGYEVYAIAPLTHDPAVFQVFQSHVDTMSEADNKGERIVVINPSIPTTALDTLVASGTNGNSTQTTNQFDTGIHGLDALILAAGLSGTGPYTVSDGIFLDIGDGNHYSAVNVVGTVVYLQTTGFLPGQNDDGFYYSGTFPAPPLELPLISEPFAIRIRGAELVLSDGVTPDLNAIALAVQQTAQGYADRRVWTTFPDTCSATINGNQELIDAFYLNAAIVGMIAQQPPQQSFTNFPMTGFTGVNGTVKGFSNSQYNVMAAGGNYIIVQDTPGAPLISRMALTTDMTSIETRTDSITKVVDFVAKFMRQGLKNYIGRFNITQGFLDSLGHVIQGLLGFLTDSGVIIGANLNNLVQDTAEPDTVLVDVTLDVPYPCNYIRLTLTI